MGWRLVCGIEYAGNNDPNADNGYIYRNGEVLC